MGQANADLLTDLQGCMSREENRLIPSNFQRCSRVSDISLHVPVNPPQDHTVTDMVRTFAHMPAEFELVGTGRFNSEETGCEIKGSVLEIRLEIQ